MAKAKAAKDESDQKQRRISLNVQEEDLVAVGVKTGGSQVGGPELCV